MLTGRVPYDFVQPDHEQWWRHSISSYLLPGLFLIAVPGRETGVGLVGVGRILVLAQNLGGDVRGYGGVGRKGLDLDVEIGDTCGSGGGPGAVVGRIG